MSIDLAYLLIILLCLASLVTWRVLGLRLLRGQPIFVVPAAAPRPLPSWVPLMLLACWYAISQFPPETLPEIPTDPAVAYDVAGARLALVGGAWRTSLLFLAMVLILRVAATTTTGDPDPRGARGTIGQQLNTGLVGFMACVLPTVAVYLVEYLFKMRSLDKLHPLLKLLAADSHPGTLAAIFVSAVLLAPLAEELLYRVILQRSLLKWLPPSTAIGVTAIAFAMVHEEWPDRVALLPLAVIQGVVYHRTGSLISIVVIHFLFNLTNIILALLQGLPAGG